MLRRSVLHLATHALCVLRPMFFGSVSTVCEPCSRSDFRGIRSHWAPAGPADAVRMGLRRQAHQRPDAAAFHRLSAAAHGSGNEGAVAPQTQSGRTATWSAHALRLALRHEAHRHEDARALRSMSATAKGFAGRRHALPNRAGCEPTVSGRRRWAAMASVLEWRAVLEVAMMPVSLEPRLR
jgi:hypothetical protein